MFKPIRSSKFVLVLYFCVLLSLTPKPIDICVALQDTGRLCYIKNTDIQKSISSFGKKKNYEHTSNRTLDNVDFKYIEWQKK